jgi:hypothetical protein
MATVFYCTILFRLRPGIALDRIRVARRSLQALVETLPGVEHFGVSHNIAVESGGFNLALFATFENRNACEIFLRHPEYRRVWNDELAPIVEKHVMAQGTPEAD